MAGTYRLPGRLLALTILARVVVLALDALLLARRVATATPSETSHHLVPHVIERYAPLVVLNLMMLNVVAPVLGLVAGAMDYASVLKAWLTLLGWLSGWVLFCLFALGIVGLLAVLGMRLADRITLRLGPAARVPAIVDRGIVALTAVYCAWAMALTFNGTFDHASATEHRSEILDVWGIPKTPLWWRTFARGTRPAASSACSSSRSATRWFPRSSTRTTRTCPVLPGFFVLRWVESMRLDFEHDLEALVAAAPSGRVAPEAAHSDAAPGRTLGRGGDACRHLRSAPPGRSQLHNTGSGDPARAAPDVRRHRARQGDPARVTRPRTMRFGAAAAIPAVVSLLTVAGPASASSTAGSTRSASSISAMTARCTTRIAGRSAPTGTALSPRHRRASSSHPTRRHPPTRPGGGARRAARRR